MDTRAVLTKVIEKVLAKGQTFPGIHGTTDFKVEGTQVHVLVDGESVYAANFETLIFDHQFCKALWGEEETDYDQSGNKFVEKWGWDYHIQRMALAEDRIAYLKENAGIQ